ncbi:MAG TPA: phospholipase D family protein [Burkholderiaceae bacterium]|nr:phospholipase D family protein [Burkholderiaceae bacterium]
MTAALRWGGFARVAALALVALAAGCASLPHDVKRLPSQAIAAAGDTELGRIAQASTPAAQRAAADGAAPSGFRLLSWSAQSLYARIELARRAQRSLDLQYYELRDDETGRLLMRTLRDAAQRGVRVRLLLDDLYTAGSDPVLSALAAFPNVEVRLFNPFPVGRGSLGARLTASLFDFGRVNHRMHNKLFIADGVMAVAGGRNIANEYFMVGTDANYIDLDVFAIGPVVPQLATLFDQYWNSEFVYPLASIVFDDDSIAERQHRFDEWTDPARAPPPAPPEPGAKDLLEQPHVHEELASGRVALIWGPAEAFADTPEKVINHTRRWPGSPQREEKTVRRGLMSELLLARHEVLVSSPYLVPNADVIEDIREGRLWGLQIVIITNSLASNDEPLVHAGYRRYRKEMLDLGVQLYEIVPSRVTQAKNLGPFGRSLGRFHAKAAAVDGKVMFIGSLNFDPRSDKHNTELGLLIRSPELTAQLMKMAELVQTEGAYRVMLSKDKSQLEWHLPSAEGSTQVLTEEPDSTWWQRLWLNLIGPLVPEDAL